MFIRCGVTGGLISVVARLKRVPALTLAHDSEGPSLTRVSALFDASHGQDHWSQTGFPSRELHTNFSGMATFLARRGVRASINQQEICREVLAAAHLLVLPPATGAYDAARERWRPQRGSLLRPDEVAEILGFLRDGGRLLAFGYRFGDSFTRTNLNHLFGPLGCLLNDDAVIDLRSLRSVHPLQSQFSTPTDCLPLTWSRHGVSAVQWRTMATFTLLPGATTWPLVFSPGGRILSFNRVHRKISFQSLPIAVCGRLGSGRFALFGGPHAFERGPFGLLRRAENVRFLENVLDWLLQHEGGRGDEPVRDTTMGASTHPSGDSWSALSQIDEKGPGAESVEFVERLLAKTGLLKALSRARWAT
jgi:hypothetical protein